MTHLGRTESRLFRGGGREGIGKVAPDRASRIGKVQKGGKLRKAVSQYQRGKAGNGPRWGLTKRRENFKHVLGRQRRFRHAGRQRKEKEDNEWTTQADRDEEKLDVSTDTGYPGFQAYARRNATNRLLRKQNP